jgi:hypothetical protein
LTKDQELLRLEEEQRREDTKAQWPERPDIASMDAQIGNEVDRDGFIVTLHHRHGHDPAEAIDDLLDAGGDAEDAPLNRPWQTVEVLSADQRKAMVVEAQTILRDSFEECRQFYGMTFRTGRGKRKTGEKLALARWLHGWHKRGVPDEVLATVTGRAPSNIAHLIDHARTLLGEAPRRKPLDTSPLAILKRAARKAEGRYPGGLEGVRREIGELGMLPRPARVVWSMVDAANHDLLGPFQTGEKFAPRSERECLQQNEDWVRRYRARPQGSEVSQSTLELGDAVGVSVTNSPRASLLRLTTTTPELVEAIA